MKLTEWLETRWVTPAYSGWLLAGIALCFFGAATNTMAGWLYVISGMIGALLALGALMPMRSLQGLKIRRFPITPVSAGDNLTVELEIENPTPTPKPLLQIWDLVPYVLDQPRKAAIEVIPPQGLYAWRYYLPTQRRGIYRWQEVQLRTGSALGLFWCRRSQLAPVKAIVYPQVLPLLRCPLVDTLGQEDSTKLQSERRYQAATEGVTKTLRPYRYGDPTRLIHWRTSAKFDEFKVRELETITGGEDIIICLDSGSAWEEEAFEKAVIAAASLYFYASRCQMNVKLWTAQTGLIQGNRVVLETLAAVEAQTQAESANSPMPASPLIWLTQNPGNLDALPGGSRWLFFPSEAGSENQPLLTRNIAGLALESHQPLQQQLQKPLPIRG